MNKPNYCPPEIYAIAPACEIRCLECTEHTKPSSCKEEIESLRIKQSLRLGNIVADEDGSPLVVMYISNGSIVARPIYQDYALVYAKCGAVGLLCPQPIPLTKELLLKLGFERIDSGHSEDHEDYHQWLEKVYPIIGCVYSGDGDYVFCEKFDDQRIYSLHQLQNLYFTITGEELEIKL